jgi:Alkyl sulfatase C-terminal
MGNSSSPDVTLTINRSDLEQPMTGAKTLEAQIAAGAAKIQGDATILKQLASTRASRSCPARKPKELWQRKIRTKRIRASQSRNNCGRRDGTASCHTLVDGGVDFGRNATIATAQPPTKTSFGRTA